MEINSAQTELLQYNPQEKQAVKKYFVVKEKKRKRGRPKGSCKKKTCRSRSKTNNAKDEGQVQSQLSICGGATSTACQRVSDAQPDDTVGRKKRRN